MLDNYLLVHKSVLPDCFDKVIYARHLVDRGEAKDVSDAIKTAGISRSTYYKYKDLIMEPSDISSGRTAVISAMLPHEPGTLSDLLKKISDAGASILTINQSIPIHGKAEVTISLDVSDLNDAPENFVKKLGVKLLALE